MTISVNKLVERLWPKHIWIIPVLLISPAVFLIPSDVFTQYPWAKTYTDWLARWIPMIDRAAHLHPHPDKFRAFFAYAWSWLPACLLLAWLGGGEGMKAHIKKLLATQVFTTLVIVPLSVWTLWLIIYAPSQAFGGTGLITRHDMRVRLYYSDWALLWSGPLQVWAACGLILVLTCIANGVRTEVLSIKTPGQKD